MNIEDKHLKRTIDKLMNDQKLEQPSVDFESVIMAKINAPVNSEVFVYKPLISNGTWAIVFLITSLILVSVYFGNTSDSNTLLDTLNIPSFNFDFSNALDFSFSKPLIYSALALSVMVVLQIPIIKAYHNKQLTVN